MAQNKQTKYNVDHKGFQQWAELSLWMHSKWKTKFNDIQANLSQVDDFVDGAAEERPQFDVWCRLGSFGDAFVVGEAEVDHSPQTMQGLVTDSADDLAEVRSMKHNVP